MKKLRQKEQRSKDLKDEDVMVELSESIDGAIVSPRTQSLEAISGPGLCGQEENPQYLQLPALTPSEDNSFSPTCDSGCEMDIVVVTREQPMSTSDLDRLENLPQTSIVSSSAIMFKHPPSARHLHHRDLNASAASKRSGTWAWKVRADAVEERCPKAEFDVDGGHETVLDTEKCSQLLIGSISVAIEDDKRLQGLHCSTPESHSNIVNHPLVKVTQPTSHAEDGCEDTNGGSATPIAENHSPSSVVTDESGSSNGELTAGGDARGGAVFSSKEASVFLSQSKRMSHRSFLL